MPAMRLALIVVFLTALVYSQAPSAVSRSSDLRAELVVVLNMSPANPLGGEIWLIDLNGRPVRRITKNNYHEEYPRFSPDGNRIVFVRNMGGLIPGVGIDPSQNEIFVYNLRTGVETRLTHNNVEDSHPEWSYHGENIAFYSRRNHPEGKATLWIMEADGSRPRQISSLHPGDLSHVDPVWGPDGQWLAFVNQREEGGVRYSCVEKVRVDGTQRTVVSSGGRYVTPSGPKAKESLGDLDPNYSPDGAMIWSARRLEGGHIHLFAFGAGAYYRGKTETDMSSPAHPDGVERNPRFSPDGRRIVLTRSSPKAGHRARQLVLTDPQSSFRRYLTSRVDWDLWHPSWYPIAHSGVDRDTASTAVSYSAGDLVESKTLSGQKDDGVSAVRGLKTPDGVYFVVTSVQPRDPKTGQIAAYEVGWKLDLPPEKIISLTLHFQGRLSGDKVEGRSLIFQLMDWDEKSWVTVFIQPEIPNNDKVKIIHEISPANFINRDSRQVLLRAIALGAQATSAHTLETDYLSLDVRRD
jgi:dipeptidyl aminopeptidase/acylaminoacyl peptidase